MGRRVSGKRLSMSREARQHLRKGDKKNRRVPAGVLFILLAVALFWIVVLIAIFR